MILKTINQEILTFRAKQIQIVPNLFYNQYETLLNIYFYYNSKYRTGAVDDEGDRKYFYNVTKNPCMIFTKGVDFDTKNIKLLTVEGGDSLKTWFMERDLKYWMRDQQFGKILNRIFTELPIYGSVVLKVVEGKPYFVDLRNFIVEAQMEALDDMNAITEIHNYTVSQFRKVAKTMKWDASKVQEVIDEFYKMKDTSHIRLYERYGDIGSVDDEGNITYSYQRAFVADVGVDEYDMYGNLIATHPGVELASDPWEGNPYWEFHVGKVSGRWLGVGVVETLFEPQIRQNELVNLQSKTSYWAALRVFQTRDPAINRNLLTDTRNGEIINADSDITQIDMTDRNLAFFNDETAKWKGNVDDLTVAFAPVGHSVIAVQIAQQQVSSYFEQVQEDIALDVKEMLYEVIIPQFQKENTTQHTLRIVGQDLDQYIEMIKNDLVNKEVIRLATSGKFPSSHDRDVISVAIGASIKQGREKILKIPKNFYQDVKFDVDIDITQESIDTQQRTATEMAILQAITADPNMLADPVKRKILYSIAEDGGLDPDDFFGTSAKSPDQVTPVPQAQQQMGGGGVSAPAMAARPVSGQVTSTV